MVISLIYIVALFIIGTIVLKGELIANDRD